MLKIVITLLLNKISKSLYRMFDTFHLNIIEYSNEKPTRYFRNDIYEKRLYLPSVNNLTLTHWYQ